MKKIGFLLLLIIAIAALCACSPAEAVPPPEPISPSQEQEVLNTGGLINAQKQADLDLLCTNLEKNHKNLYANISKEDFAAEKQKISEKIPTLSDNEFFYSLKALVAKVGDAHTRIDFEDSRYNHLQALPFAVDRFDGLWFFLMCEKVNSQYLGYGISAINDTPIEEIYERAKAIISYENEAWLENNFSNTINFSDALYYLGVTKDLSEVTLTLKNPENGEDIKLPIKSLPGKKIFDAEIVSYPAPVPKTRPDGSIYRAFSLNSDNYFIQYNSCDEDPNFAMKDFIEQIKKDISENNYKSVIVDLRYNSGGNSAIFEPAIDSLKKLQKEKGFSLYTLIGRNTFSSAVINAVQLTERTKCTLVGTPTGGNVNGYGEVKAFNLPNLHCDVTYSSKYFELIKGYEKDSLYPDIEVMKTIVDVKAGRDVEVETVFEVSAE